MSLILSGTDGISDVDGSASTPALRGTDANTGIFFPAADTIAFSEGGVESMRITSAGDVGIGTTSPSTVLQVTKNQNATTRISVTNSDTTNTSSRAAFQATSGTVNLDVTAIQSLGGYIGTSSNHQLNLVTNGNDRLSIDTSGNVGIACTPSAWGSTYKPIQFGLGGSIHGRTDTTAIILGQNTYRDSANDYKYIATTAAGLYTLGTGIHSWFGAPSGTAGNTVTFTQILAVSRSNSLALEGATSQAGTGITFPATQSASTDVNTLDDYEEGTWTPTIVSQTGSITSYTSAGQYTKIGRNVFLTFTTTLTNVGTAGGRLQFSNLPFTALNLANGRPAVFVGRENAATGIPVVGWLDGSQTTGEIASLSFTAITWTNGYQYTMSVTYQSTQ